jgi:hypothetical protein
MFYAVKNPPGQQWPETTKVLPDEPRWRAPGWPAAGRQRRLRSERRPPLCYSTRQTSPTQGSCTAAADTEIAKPYRDQCLCVRVVVFQHVTSSFQRG